VEKLVKSVPKLKSFVRIAGFLKMDAIIKGYPKFLSLIPKPFGFGNMSMSSKFYRFPVQSQTSPPNFWSSSGLFQISLPLKKIKTVNSKKENQGD